jgi:hypothetical protein
VARIPPWSELEKGTNSGFDRDVCSRFATDEEGGAVDAREVQETADVVVLVECREKRLCVFSGKCEGSEGDWLAEACGQAAIAVHDFAEVFHNRRAIGARDAAPRPNSFVQILELASAKKTALSGGSVSRQSVSGKRRARSTSRARPDDERMFGEGSGSKMRTGLASNHAAPE